MGYPDLEKYRLLAKDLGILNHVTFTGQIDYATEAPLFLSAGDLAVAPKLDVSESNGKVLLYMAMGLPTVVFDNPTNRFLLGDLGIYAQNSDAASLAKALLGALTQSPDPGLNRAMRDRVLSRFSRASFRSRLLRIYESVIT
jgi:glycosyltransferase involved in cell wall biosynthesis